MGDFLAVAFVQSVVEDVASQKISEFSKNQMMAGHVEYYIMVAEQATGQLPRVSAAFSRYHRDGAKWTLSDGSFRVDDRWGFTK
jgi:hypothetical protein